MSEAAPAPTVPPVERTTLENILKHLGLDFSEAGLGALAQAKLEVKTNFVDGLTTRSGRVIASTADEHAAAVLSTSSATGQASIESLLKCERCSNIVPELFEWNADNGDVVCRKCGTVAMDHALFEGEAHRTFEDDDEDKSHAGRNVSEHLSDSYNLGTMVVAKDERADNTVKDLRRTLREIETIEHLQGEASGGVRATRMWYKDNMKRKAFQLIKEVVNDLFLGEYAIDVACAKFAKFRDGRDKVRNFKLVVAACIVIGVEEEVMKRPPPPVPKFKCDRCDEMFHTPRQVKDHYYACPRVSESEKQATRIAAQKDEAQKKRKLRATQPDFLEFGGSGKDKDSSSKYEMDRPVAPVLKRSRGYAGESLITGGSGGPGVTLSADSDDGGDLGSEFVPVQMPKGNSGRKWTPFQWLKLGVALSSVAMAAWWLVARPTVSLIIPSQYTAFRDPVINGPMQHALVFSGVPKAVVQVWAHPHNNDPNFDFWSAVGTFNAASEPNSGGWGSNYFQPLTTLLAARGSVYVGVGAWIGASALYAATLPFQPEVWAFEPDPLAFAELDANAKLNPTLLPRIHVSNLCIDAVEGEQTLYGTGDSESRLHTVTAGFDHSSKRKHTELPAYKVQCVKLETAVNRFGIDPDPSQTMVIHIDTEGSEYNLIPALFAFVQQRQKRPVIMVEMHGEPPSITARNQLIWLLESYPALYRDRVEPSTRIEQIGNPCKNCLYFALPAAV